MKLRKWGEAGRVTGGEIETNFPSRVKPDELRELKMPIAGQTVPQNSSADDWVEKIVISKQTVSYHSCDKTPGGIYILKVKDLWYFLLPWQADGKRGIVSQTILGCPFCLHELKQELTSVPVNLLSEDIREHLQFLLVQGINTRGVP